VDSNYSNYSTSQIIREQKNTVVSQSVPHMKMRNRIDTETIREESNSKDYIKHTQRGTADAGESSVLFKD
jgi:hypothetical protein